MGWRFRKYVNIAPGVRLNLSKKGISTTLGKKGASINIGKNGTYLNTGIPGTGLYSRQKLSNGDNNMANYYNSKVENGGCIKKLFKYFFIIFGLIGTLDLFITINHLVRGNIEFDKDSFMIICLLGIISIVFILYCYRKISPIYRKRFSKTISDKKLEQIISAESSEIKKTFLQGLTSQHNETSEEQLIIDDKLNDRQKESYKHLCSKFRDLKSSDRIWVILSETANEVDKSSVSKHVMRIPVTLSEQNFNNVGCSETNCVPMFSDARYDYYIYPKFIVKVKSDVSFETYPIENTKIYYGTQTFVEDLPSAELPKDSKLIKYTYSKVNKDGTPDLRYSNNKKRPVYLYGRIKLDSIGAIFIISDTNKAKSFANAFAMHKTALMTKQERSIGAIHQINEDENIQNLESTINSVKTADKNKLISDEEWEAYIIKVVKLLLVDNYVTPKYLCEKTGLNYSLMLTILDKISALGISDESGVLLIHNESELYDILNKTKTSPIEKGLIDCPSLKEKDDINNAEITENSNSTLSIPSVKKNPLDEIGNLIGLDEVKKEVNNLVNLVKIQKIRKDRGLKTSPISYHCVFTGNPGTGKTTVARLIAEIYKELGVLKKGHLIETDRSGLVAEYVGQTAPKTNAIIDSALDGVLFIDEAYSLVQSSQNDYGNEAISTLLKRMEDDRERLVVILAGYSKEMEEFINSNSGLQSRFNRYLYFPDYTANELMEIFKSIVRKNELKVSEEALARVNDIILRTLGSKDENYGNARFVRNLFEKILSEQANRLSSESNITNEMLSMIELSDVPETY